MAFMGRKDFAAEKEGRQRRKKKSLGREGAAGSKVEYGGGER